MENMNFGEILIYISALIVAITTIYNFCSSVGIFTKKKVSKAQKQKVETVLDEQLNERVAKILADKMPEILHEHDLEVRETYLADRQRYLNEIKAEVTHDMQGEFTVLDELKDYVSQLALSAKDVLREKIMGLYHKNKDDRTLTENEKEALDVYYKDYKAIGGNSYIDRYYRRMSSWRVIPDTYVDHNEHHDGHDDEHNEH